MSRPSKACVIPTTDTSSIQSSLSSTSTSFLLLPASASKEQQANFGHSYTFGSVQPDALPDHLGSISTILNPANGTERWLNGVADEFPHLDIINDLLDEEQSITGSAESGCGDLYYAHPDLHQAFRCQNSFPGDATSVDINMLGDFSGRYQQYYDDRFQGVYPQMDLPVPFAIGQVDGVATIHWSPYGHTDVYPHHFSDYPAANGYSDMHNQP